MFKVIHGRNAAAIILLAVILAGGLLFWICHPITAATEGQEEVADFIKWVDFQVPQKVMEQAIAADIASQTEPVKINWIELLAYLSAKNGGNFKNYKQKEMDALINRLKNGEGIADITQDMKYYSYYHEAYTAIFAQFVGPYRIEVKDPNASEGKTWSAKYGLRAFSPIARDFPFNHYRDFGTGRNFGYKRKHLGNDLIGAVGTPIVAIEGGVVEELGWNMYGGWRIGIRSHDKKRYYYYAHLRKNFPYNKSLAQGSVVKAGDVIGYLGRSGYSTTANTNNIETPHLHIGLQLVFDESQKEGPSEIWIDVYDIINVLQKNRAEVIKDPATKEYSRVYQFEIIE